MKPISISSIGFLSIQNGKPAYSGCTPLYLLVKYVVSGFHTGYGKGRKIPPNPRSPPPPPPLISKKIIISFVLKQQQILLIQQILFPGA